MTPTMRVRAIGTAEIRIGHTRIRPDSAVLFALALYLACHAGKRVPRAHLLELLWPGVADLSRRHALRQLLYRLRKSGLALALDGDDVLVETAEVESDLDAMFDAAWPESAGADDIAGAAVMLPGYAPAGPEPYREWLDAIRARATAQFRRAALRQIACARRDGRWAHVEEWAERCLAVDPLNEEATLARAEALAMTGSKARALEMLDNYLAELGPRANVIGLPAKVLRRRISEQGRPSSSKHAGVATLVGRDCEIRRLNALLSETLDGRRVAALVVGAPGIGKTALADELVGSARLRGWHSVTARLQASDAHRPLAAFVDLLTVLMQLPGALGCDPASLIQLRRLTQYEVELPADTRRSQEAEAVRERIRSAALDLFAAVCDEGPIVVVLENLHWTDSESILMLQRLMERTSARPIFWLLTARPEARFAELREALTEKMVETLRLEPLGADDSVALFRSLSDGAAHSASPERDQFSDALTGGNPFFIREVALHFVESGSMRSLPNSLRTIIHDRVARLPRTTQHVLHTCAILGRYSTTPRVAAVLEMGTARLLACLEDLDTVGILGKGADADELAMHDLWQEELLSTVRSVLKQLIHRRCGAVLESESRHTKSASMMWEASRHLIASGAHAQALSVLEECARHLLDNGLALDAAQTFGLAFDTAQTDPQRLRTLSGRVEALHRAAKWTELADVIPRAIQLSRTCSGGVSAHSDLELLQTELLWKTEADTNSCLERALSCAADQAAAPAHRARAGLIAARVASNLARWESLKTTFELASGLPSEGGADQACILSIATIYHTEIGSIDQAIETSEHLVSVERKIGSVRGLSRALRFAAYPLRCLGEFDRAIGLLHEALMIGEDQRLIEDACTAADMLVTIHVERSDLPTAKVWLQRAEVWAEQVGARYSRNSLNAERAIIALASGAPRDAVSFVQMDVDRLIRDPLVRQRVMNLAILARLLVALGKHDALEEILGGLRDGLARIRNTPRHDYFTASVGLILVALGRQREATDYVRQYVEHSRTNRRELSAEMTAMCRE